MSCRPLAMKPGIREHNRPVAAIQAHPPENIQDKNARPPYNQNNVENKRRRAAAPIARTPPINIAGMAPLPAAPRDVSLCDNADFRAIDLKINGPVVNIATAIY